MEEGGGLKSTTRVSRIIWMTLINKITIMLIFDKKNKNSFKLFSQEESHFRHKLFGKDVRRLHEVLISHFYDEGSTKLDHLSKPTYLLCSVKLCSFFGIFVVKMSNCISGGWRRESVTSLANYNRIHLQAGWATYLRRGHQVRKFSSSGVNFTNTLCSAFTCADPQSTKR